MSLISGEMPDCLKVAKVVPIFKKGDSEDLNNYRPVSVLSPISKVFERVVLKRLDNFFDSRGLFYHSQYGFRRNRSTTYAIAEFVTFMILNVDSLPWVHSWTCQRHLT